MIARSDDRQPSGPAVCASSTWTTSIAGDGTLHHLLRLRLHNWQRPYFEIIVPGTVTALAARIDGGWLDRLDTTTTPEGTKFSLPVHTGAAVQWIELLCAAPGHAPSWHSIQNISAPYPQLPPELNRALTQRRFWRAPLAWLPWDESKLRPRGQLENGGDGQGLAVLAGRAWNAGAELLRRQELPSAGWIDAQRAELAKAESKVHPAGRETTLGDALERLAAETRLVIDVDGLRAAGRGPWTKLHLPLPAGKPFWESVGLVHVPGPSATLVDDTRTLARLAPAARQRVPNRRTARYRRRRSGAHRDEPRRLLRVGGNLAAWWVAACPRNHRRRSPHFLAICGGA